MISLKPARDHHEQAKRATRLLEAIASAGHYARLSQKPHVVYLAYATEDGSYMKFDWTSLVDWGTGWRDYHNPAFEQPVNVLITIVNPDGSHEQP